MQAVRNFVQLCLEGYYDKTPFFRIDKGFMAQAGDPTGTGRGGESVYGHPFNDEFHSRLKFNHRSAFSNPLHAPQRMFSASRQRGKLMPLYFWTEADTEAALCKQFCDCVHASTDSCR